MAKPVLDAGISPRRSEGFQAQSFVFFEIGVGKEGIAEVFLAVLLSGIQRKSFLHKAPRVAPVSSDATMEAEQVVAWAEVVQMGNLLPILTRNVVVSGPLVVFGVEIDARDENTADL